MHFSMHSWNAPTGGRGSPPSFGQGIPASNGLTRTVVAEMAFDFPHFGDEKFEFNEIQVGATGPSEKPDVHLSKLFLVQMMTLAGIECDSVRVSRGIDYISKFNFTTPHPKMCNFLWTRMHFETLRGKWECHGGASFHI